MKRVLTRFFYFCRFNRLALYLKPLLLPIENPAIRYLYEKEYPYLCHRIDQL
jgi:hypothetical protein